MDIKLYKNILEKVTCPYIIVKEHDLDKFKILELNDSFTSLVGFDKQELIDKNMEFLFENDESIYEYIKLCKKEDTYKSKIYIKSLKWWYDIKIDSIEQNLYIIWFESVHKVNEGIKYLLNKTVDIVWVKDKDLKYTHISEKGLDKLKLKYEDVIGKTDFDILDEKIAKVFFDSDKSLLLGGKDSNKAEMELFGCIYEANTDIIKDNEGNPIGILGYAIDKTEEIKLKNQLKQQHQTIEILMDAIPDYIFYKDLDSMLVYCNKSYAEKLVELPKSEIIGKKDSDMKVVNQDAHLYRERDLEVINSNSMKTYYEDVTLKDGSIVNLETIKVPYYNHHNEIIGLIGIARDITERIKYRNEIENIKMEFFTNLSHELRTPINIIFSTIQMMKFRLNTLKEEDYNFYKRYIDMTNQNALRLLKLVNNLIDSNKIDSGYIDFQPENYDIVNFVENICMSVSEFMKQKNMDIIFDTDTEQKIVCIDLDKVERIILNLLSNAIKFNKENEQIKVNISEDKDFISISVKDNGIGIPKDKLPYIFNRFKQVENSHVKLREGSGIGLSLVKSLVEMHDGEINVNSIENEGTEFIVKIPNKINEDIEYNEIDTMYDLKVDSIRVEFCDIYNNE